MARDILAIQVSTVASESAFTGGRVLDPFRSSLSPSMVQALICTQNWIRASSLPLDMSSILEDVETFESISSGSVFFWLLYYHNINHYKLLKCLS